jgi:site-specific DNA recombinase
MRQQKKRCAIYTRKSVEDGLEKEFNTLDAQREAGEAYIASQKANGWVCLPERYDDGGFSGGNMKRPALQKLLADAEAGLVDVIVVYKIDRLSRSIIDFSELSGKLDEWSVSFVSVTQEINTSTSSGRMMLNILMTFAQYEREIIAERIKDKMSAHRRKGMWTGGAVPYGYQPIDKKLQIVEAEAEVIRWMYQRFTEVQSPKQIALELNQQGTLNKYGKEWDRAYIARILANQLYVGKVKYQGIIYDGEHEAIVEPEIWKRVREIANSNNLVKEPKGRIESTAPLKGILRCGHCDCAMSPTYGKKKSKQYFYYVCSRDQHRLVKECPVGRISAGEVEQAVLEQIKVVLHSDAFVEQCAVRLGIPAEDVCELLNPITEVWDEMAPGERNRLMTLLVDKAEIHDDKLEITLKVSGIDDLIRATDGEKLPSAEAGENIKVTVPIKLRQNNSRRELLVTDGSGQYESTLAVCIARGFYWQKLIDEGAFKDAKDLAQSMNLDRSYVARTIKLSCLSPRVIHAVIAGDIPDSLSLDKLRGSIPELWSEQEKVFLKKQ